MELEKVSRKPLQNPLNTFSPCLLPDEAQKTLNLGGNPPIW